MPQQGRSSESKVHTFRMGGPVWSIRDKTGPLPAHPTGAPPTGGLGPGPGMEAARGLTALICGVPERGPGVELERSLLDSCSALMAAKQAKPKVVFL